MFKILLQSRYLLTTKVIVNITENSKNSTAYVVLTYSLANFISPFAFASAKRLRKPCANPKSKYDNQAMMELNVNQIPYFAGFT